MTKFILFNQWLYLKGIIVSVLLLKMKKKMFGVGVRLKQDPELNFFKK